MSSDVEVYDSDSVSPLEYQVYCARLAGYSVPEIADRMELSQNEVIEAYNAYRIKISHYRTGGDRDEALALEIDRLDHMQATFYELAQQGDARAADIVLKAIATRSKLKQLDQIDPRSNSAVQNILVVGEDKKAFLEALMSGRKSLASDESMEDEEA